MQSTFYRAFLGFIVLTAAIIGMALIALWSIATFADGLWWASILIVLIALVVEVGIYSSTLHDPIYQWIKEPAQRAAVAKREQDEKHRVAQEKEWNRRRNVEAEKQSAAVALAKEDGNADGEPAKLPPPKSNN